MLHSTRLVFCYNMAVPKVKIIRYRGKFLNGSIITIMSTLPMEMT